MQPHLLPALMVYVVVIHFAGDDKKLDFVMLALIGMGLLSGLAVLFAAITQGSVDSLVQMRLAKIPLFVAPNDVLMLSVIVSLALTLLLTSTQMMVRIIAILYLVIALMVIIFFQSRQAVAVYLISFFVFFFLMKPLLGCIIASLGLAMVLGIDILLGKGLINKFFMFPRLYIWDTAWTMFLDRPIVGMGPGMYQELYHEYLEKAGYIFEELDDRRPMNWAHSLFLEQLAERGLMGFTALLILLLRPVVAVFARFRNLSPSPLKIRLIGLLSAFVAFVFSGLAEASLLRIWVVVLLFSLLSLAEVLVKVPAKKQYSSQKVLI